MMEYSAIILIIITICSLGYFAFNKASDYISKNQDLSLLMVNNDSDKNSHVELKSEMVKENTDKKNALSQLVQHGDEIFKLMSLMLISLGIFRLINAIALDNSSDLIHSVFIISIGIFTKDIFIFLSNF